MIRKSKEFFPVVQIKDGSRRVARRAYVDKLSLRKCFGTQYGQIEFVAVFARQRQVHGIGSGQKRCAFVDLIEGNGHHDFGAAFDGRVDKALDQTEKGFAGAEHRQDFGCGIRGQPVAAFAPGADGFTQGRVACRARVGAHERNVLSNRFANALRNRMTGFADAERNRLEFTFGRNNSLKEFAQSGKRVGAGARKSGIGHGRILCKRSGLSEKRRGHIQKIIRWLLP